MEVRVEGVEIIIIIGYIIDEGGVGVVASCNVIDRQRN